MARKINYSVREKTLSVLREQLGDVASRKDIVRVATENDLPYPGFIFIDKQARASRGTYHIGENNNNNVAAMVATVSTINKKSAMTNDTSFVPPADPNFVKFGFTADLIKIIKSGVFYPVYVTGLSGNGKTVMVEQVCASLKRECIRVNITRDSDELDLIGSYELIDGNTVRRDGPAIVAMRRGAVLLLDEVDYGSERLLCLQSVIEGKGFFDKKTGQMVYPAPGFNIIATANTKGKGSDDGRFVGANILNEAFLERFAITVEQEYPTAKIETQILKNNFDSLGINDDDFINKLVEWAGVIRKAFDDGAVDEIVSTRRLIHISKAYSIFKNRRKSIELCLNRFDSDTKTSFLDLYSKIDAEQGEAATSLVDESRSADGN